MSMICPKCKREYDDDRAFCADDGEPLAPVVDPLVGQVIDNRLRLERKLGQGGMGRVYLAQHIRLPLKTAVKVLHPDVAHDADAVRRFNEEAERAARIIDEHVARVHDFGQTPEGLVYLEMEFVEGTTLSDLLDETGPLPPKRVADIIEQIAGALAAAHDLRIVHRDLKPENVMIAPGREGTDRVKVLDFGIAKVIAEGLAQATKTGAVIGTPDYMSPEQLGGARDLDQRSDVYSLGLVAFVMLTGQLAFPGELPYERMMTRLVKPPRRLAETKRDLRWPAALQSALDRALSRETDRRYASAMEFSRDFSAAVEGVTPARFGLHFPHLSRTRVIQAVSGLAALAVITTAVVAWPRPTPPKPPPGRTHRPTLPGPTQSGTQADTINGTGSIDQPPDTVGSPLVPPVVPPVDRPARHDATWVKRRLAQANALLAPGASTSRADASEVIRIVQDVLPYARTVAESVEVQYDEIEAYLALTPSDPLAATRACRVLHRIRERARATAFSDRVARLSATELATRC
jgi:serine/threonine-protein kinase